MVEDNLEVSTTPVDLKLQSVHDLEVELEIAKTSTEFVKQLVKLADKLETAKRGDKSLIKKIFCKRFDIDLPYSKTKVKNNKIFDGYKSIAACIEWFSINETKNSVIDLLLSVDILRKGDSGKGYILDNKYGKTEKLNSDPRPKFTAEGAEMAFKKVGLL